MARPSAPRKTIRVGPRKRKSDELIVNLDEFASLCGVTPQTMRTHMREAPADADWILERGTRGRGFKIAAERGLAWYRNRATGNGEDDLRRQKLAELRLQMLGGDASEDDVLLTGKQRYEEYKAGEAELAYRQAMGELTRVSEIEAEMVNAVIELRRHLLGVGKALRRRFKFEKDVELAIDEMIGERLKQFVAALDADADDAA